MPAYEYLVTTRYRNSLSGASAAQRREKKSNNSFDRGKNSYKFRFHLLPSPLKHTRTSAFEKALQEFDGTACSVFVHCVLEVVVPFFAMLSLINFSRINWLLRRQMLVNYFSH
ncbi:MAG: hypothetical protein ACTS8S_16100 [Giesbergeria sp.]